ncbi:MAG: NAD(P)/FAD-dependent oxidoreductase [Gammaproteobacteria bacterium]|nr:NAD(P)/FAD-dependent oxidoreductase [Gammaproteobacteria bacterium]
MTEHVECVVIGAGVVGLAVARALALAGRETLVLEAEAAIGSGISARNSEVVHGGMYYPPGSAKAQLCVRGRTLLYEYCEARGVPYRRCGKLIVAAEAAELPALEALAANAAANGVQGLERLSGAAARALEPQLACHAALLSTATGIIDGHGLMRSLVGDLEQAGGSIALRCPLVGGHCDAAGIHLQTGGAAPLALRAQRVVNSAGLGAQQVARLLGLPAHSIPPRFLAKGSYFTLRGRAPFAHLIYPMPERAALGVHLTLDLAGQARFGPYLEWVEDLDYAVDPARAAGFYAAIRRYWPALPDGALLPGYAGIRPKIHGPGSAPADFLIQGPAGHGQAGLVNLYGIESPGLTSALAIAERVAALLQGSR